MWNIVCLCVFDGINFLFHFVKIMFLFQMEIFLFHRHLRQAFSWLINYCLASSEHYSSYNQNKNKFNDIQKIYWNERTDVLSGSTTFNCYWKGTRSWIETKDLVFCSGCTAPTLLRKSTKEVFSWCVASCSPKTLPTFVYLAPVLNIAEILLAAR